MGARQLAVLTAMAALAAPAGAAAEVTSHPVTFEVANVNRSALSCQTDGARYRLRGLLVGPADALRGRRVPVATLYLHDFGFGKWFWSFPGAGGGYDYAAAQARRGHVSVLVDRLGYDESDHPLGLNSCTGGQADIAHQVVDQLGTGSYGGDAHPAIERIVLAGHSVGVGIAELSMYSFPDARVAGLAVFAWADQGFSQETQRNAAEQGVVCTRGGEPAEPGEPGFYAFTPQTAEGFHRVAFHSARPDVRGEATRLWNRDPCGDAATIPATTALNQTRLGELQVPVLLMFGRNDPVWDPGAPDKQAQLFAGSPDVTLKYFPDTGHALTLEASAADVRNTVAEWLSQHRLEGPALPARGRPLGTCRSRRRFRVRLGRGLRGARATVDRRRAKVIRGRVWRVEVRLRRLRGRTSTLRVRLVTRNGQTVRLIRRYRFCGRRAGTRR